MQRSYELPGNKVHFKKHPRYGTWSVGFDKGGIPESLDGEYTLFADIFYKTNYYLANREKNPTEIGPEIKNA